MRNKIAGVALGLALVVCVPPGLAAQGAPGDEYSRAQTALFRTPHLDNVTEPTTLEYEYRRSAGPDDTFVDTVRMSVTQISPDQGKTVKFEYLTGSHARPYGEVTDFRGNPLIMVFLEEDLRRMQQKLGGGGLYMRNRIRHAFYEQEMIQSVTFELGGRPVVGTQIKITPFVGDKNRDKLGDYENKIYEFVVSPEVPGGIFMMRSTVPSSSGATKPLYQDSLTFRGSHS